MVYRSLSRVTKHSAAAAPVEVSTRCAQVRAGPSTGVGVLGEGTGRRHPSEPCGGTGMRQAAGRQPVGPPRSSPSPVPSASEGGGHRGSRGDPATFPRGGSGVFARREKSQKNYFMYIYVCVSVRIYIYIYICACTCIFQHQ